MSFIQLVTKALNKQLPRIATWLRCGYVVVLLDNRGSANRGVKFESYIKVFVSVACECDVLQLLLNQDYLGNYELKDQIAGLHKAVSMFDFIDDSRVAITGWSYGGYLSLLGIATYPHIFKVLWYAQKLLLFNTDTHLQIAISGAPVTDWCWYDTGYTERYLGVTPNAKQYQQSSILSVCDKFPNE